MLWYRRLKPDPELSKSRGIARPEGVDGGARRHADMVDDERLPLHVGEKPRMKKVRFRTLGCYPLTGAEESDADFLEAIVAEIQASRLSERKGRAIDRDASGAMEKKKRDGYF